VNYMRQAIINRVVLFMTLVALAACALFAIAVK